MYHEIAENPDIPNNSNAIWNLNDYCFDQAERRFFQILINGRAQFPGRSQARVVLVAENDLGFGMCRMYQIMCDLNQAIADNTTYVVRSVDEAIEWLAANQTDQG